MASSCGKWLICTVTHFYNGVHFSIVVCFGTADKGTLITMSMYCHADSDDLNPHDDLTARAMPGEKKGGGGGILR